MVKVKRIWLRLPERVRVAGATFVIVTVIDAVVLAVIRPPREMLLTLVGLIWIAPLLVAVPYTLFWPDPKPFPAPEPEPEIQAEAPPKRRPRRRPQRGKPIVQREIPPRQRRGG